MTKSLLEILITRGDRVFIAAGKLSIEPISGKAIPRKWIKSHQNQLLTEICSLLDLTPFRYISFSTGHYKICESGKLSGGVTLQFENLITGEAAFTVFNAELKRQRTTKQGKAGDRLPNKQFRIRPRSNFQKFWNSAKLKQIDQSKIHRYMGLLKEVLFTFDPNEKQRVSNEKIKLLEVPFETIRAAFSVPNSCLSHAYAVPKPCLRAVPKGSPLAQSQKAFQPNSTTGESSYGNKVTREYGNKASNIQDTTEDQLNSIGDPNLTNAEDAINQSVNAWVEEYENTPAIGKR